MKIDKIKINNYKSLGEEDNTLTVDDLNIIVGKNESGKSNIVEAIAGIDLTGMNDKIYFDKKNKMNLDSPISIEIELEPYSSELKLDKKLTTMTINIYSNYDISYEGGFSESISKNKEFNKARNSIREITSETPVVWADDQAKKRFEKLILSFECAETNIFIDYNYISDLFSRIENSQYTFKDDLLSNLKKCRKILLSYYRYLPTIFYVDNQELESEYTKNEIENNSTDEVKMFYKLLDVSKIDIDYFLKYWDSSSDNAIKAQISRNINKKIKENLVDNFNKFYKQESINIELSFYETNIALIVDTSGTYMNYDERSQGLKWYLNTYIKLQAKNIKRNNVVYIMDEPGIKLHVNAQKELISFYKELIKNENQIIYTSHSPYMIDQNNLNTIRLISKDEIGFTHIYNKFNSFPKSDKSKMDTMTPVYDAMGFDYKYNFGPSNNKLNIIVEGPSDYNYIHAYMLQKNISKKSKPYIIPSMGVNNINRIVSILIGWGCDYAIILDNDEQGRNEYKKLTKKLGVEKEKIVFTDGTNEINDIVSHTIENIFDKNDYDKHIKKDNYDEFKIYYSKCLLNKVEKKEILLSEKTMENFDKVIKNLLK